MIRLRNRVSNLTGKKILLNHDNIVHIGAVDIREALTGEVYDEFYKFAFVRNPWDWNVSLYFHLLKYELAPDHHLVSKMSGFPEYLEWSMSRKYRQQKDFIVDSNNSLLLDFLGRYESITEDFNHVCKTLGMNKTLPQLNVTSHADYRSYYDQHTREIIARHFAGDIELFKYKF